MKYKADSIVVLLVNLALEGLTLLFQPAKEATVPTLVQRNEIVRANSLSLSAAYGTFPLGAAIFLAISPLASHITLWGFLPGSHEGLAFLLDAFTYLGSSALISTLPSTPRSLSTKRKRRKGFDPMAVLRDRDQARRFLTFVDKYAQPGALSPARDPTLDFVA